MDMSRESLDILSQTNRGKALDTFVKNLRRLLGIREPTDVSQALNQRVKLEKQQYRTQWANSHPNINQARRVNVNGT